MSNKLWTTPFSLSSYQSTHLSCKNLPQRAALSKPILPLNGTKNIVSKPTTVNLGLQVGHLVIRFAEFRPGEEGGTGKGGSWEKKGLLQLTAVKFLGKLSSPLIS